MADASTKIKNYSLILLSLSACLASYSYYHNSNEYQLVQLGEFRRDQFLLDKKTGRTWFAVCTGEPNGPDCDGEIIWQERVATGLNGFSHEDYRNYLERIEEKRKKSEKKK